MTFFAGNSKLILVKKQVDKDTPITDFSTARAFRVYEWAKDPSRVISELQESDASTQQAASRVTAIGPALTFGVYGRPSELDFISEALLGDNDDSATSSPTTHTATPSVDQPYYSIMEYLPYGGGESPVWDGCRLFAGQGQSQDEGETDLQITGLAWTALGLTHGVTVPDPLPTPAAEAPFIHAELAVKYAGVHLGTTKAIQFSINRNGGRRQGDSGFRAIDATPGKFQVDGSASRYTADDQELRTIDTGTPSGTDLTSIVQTEALAMLWTRGSGASLRSFLFAAPSVSKPTREEALNLDGTPFVEVLAFRTEPQADLADNVALVTVNAKATTA